MRKTDVLLVALWLTFASCQSRLKEADAFIKAGSLPEAEQILRQELAKKPGNAEARLMLGRVYLLELRENEAHAILDPLAPAGFAQRVGREYSDAADALKKRNDVPALAIGTYSRYAATFDPSLARPVCDAMLEHMRREKQSSADIAPQIAMIDTSCREKTLRTLAFFADDADPATVDLPFLESVGATLFNIDRDRATDFARAIRKLAGREAHTDRRRAAQILATATRVDAGIAEELETVVLRSSLGDPGPPAESSRGQDFLTRYSGSPVEVTKRIMNEIGNAIVQYGMDYNRYPVARSFDELRAMIARYAGGNVDRVDAWGMPFLYISLRDNGSVRLISGGADHHIENSSRDLKTAARGVVQEFGADLIWQDGGIVQEPAPSAETVPDLTSLRH